MMADRSDGSANMASTSWRWILRAMACTATWLSIKLLGALRDCDAFDGFKENIVFRASKGGHGARQFPKPYRAADIQLASHCTQRTAIADTPWRGPTGRVASGRRDALQHHHPIVHGPDTRCREVRPQASCGRYNVAAHGRRAF